MLSSFMLFSMMLENFCLKITFWRLHFGEGGNVMIIPTKLLI